MKLFLQGLSIAVVAASFIMIVWRMLPNMGVPLKKRIDKPLGAKGCVPGRGECARVFGYSMLFRVFVIAAAFVVFCVFKDNGNKIQWSRIYESWMQWDARNYVRIAEGYTSYSVDGEYTMLVFFPLYSWLIAIAKIVVRQELVAGLLVSALCSSGAAVYLYKLFCEDYGRRTAQISVILLCVFPFGFFLSSIMSESAFLLTSAATLYYVRKHNWIGAGIAGMLCALSRSAGVFLIFPATVELLESEEIFRDFGKKLLPALKKWLPLLLLPAGTCIYLVINYKLTGDPFFFLKMEKKVWFQESQPFFKTVGTLWDNSFGSNRDVSTRFVSFVPGIIILFSMYAVMLLGIRRHRSMYSVWLWVYLMVNTAMSWPLSLCRYLSCAIPVYIILGYACSKNKKLLAGFMIGFSVLFGIYLTAYIMSKQLM